MFEQRAEVNRVSDIAVSESCVSLAVKLGLCDRTENEETAIKELLWLSVPTKHPNGNKRYKDWIFRVKGNVLVGIHLVKCVNCDDSKRLEVWDECSQCGGDGCKSCLGGLRKGSIPCPTCTHK